MRFALSRGGVPEISPQATADQHCHLHLVDVRESDEIAEGHIPGVEAVRLDHVAEASAHWDRREPIVFVCRSGRRSARAVRQVEAMGFTQAASMTGGMLAWAAAGLPIERGDQVEPTSSSETAPVSGALEAAFVERLLRQTHLPRVRAASLLLQGSEACVDGREQGAVIGTPGGDAGELLLLLATYEKVTGQELDQDAVRRFFLAHVSGFGRFYLHSDDHALDNLKDALTADPRFASVANLPTGALLEQPPVELRAALLEHLRQPANIGCGHLRLVASNPEEYGVRTALTEELLDVFFDELWHDPEQTEFVVLHGDHHEEGVLSVSLPQKVEPFDNLPAIPPLLGGRSFFIHHPQTADFVRQQQVRFLFERTPWLTESLQKAGVDEAAYTKALGELAGRQLHATLQHLARELPVYEVAFDRDGAFGVRALE
ncbi:MAG: rhodanese-like domain-containing protein [Myxococcales bacterium]|nr:rhodanese-like domain-containing protein [Myxococcales bacterium]